MVNVPIQYVTMDKCPHFFKQIAEDDGVVRQEVKNNYGSTRSVINGQLEALYFSAIFNWFTVLPFEDSRFGNMRLSVLAHHHMYAKKHMLSCITQRVSRLQIY